MAKLGAPSDQRVPRRGQVAVAGPVRPPASRGGLAQRRILAEDRAFQPTQLPSRVDAEFVRQHRPGPLIRTKRVTLPPGPVEGNDELAPEALPERMRAHQGFKLSRELALAAEHQIGLDPVLDGGQPRLLQPGNHRGSEPGVGELG